MQSDILINNFINLTYFYSYNISCSNKSVNENYIKNEYRTNIMFPFYLNIISIRIQDFLNSNRKTKFNQMKID